MARGDTPRRARAASRESSKKRSGNNDQNSPPRASRCSPAERNSARLLPYHRVDVSISRDFIWYGQSFEWFVQVFNVYSRRNEWFVQYNLEDATAEPEVVKMLPIIPSLGVNFKF